MAKRKLSKKLLTEDVIAEGVLLEPVTATNSFPVALEAGTKVKIARIINTPVGHRLRIAHSTRWLPREAVTMITAYSDEDVIDYTGHLSPNKGPANSLKTKGNSPKRSRNTGKEFKTCEKRATPKLRRRRKVGRSERQIGMDKKQLKNLISGFDTAEKIEVTFLGELADRTGNYEVVETKVGRGKGGSMLMTLKGADGETFTTGTPQSDKILHVVTTDGIMHGYQSKSDIPRSFEMNAARGEELKAEMKKLVGTTGARIRLDDTQDEFGGEYTVTQAIQKRGRYGQVLFTLMNDDGNIKEFWSHRHSGIVPENGYEVLSVPDQNTLPNN